MGLVLLWRRGREDHRLLERGLLVVVIGGEMVRCRSSVLLLPSVLPRSREGRDWKWGWGISGPSSSLKKKRRRALFIDTGEKRW